MHKKNPSKLVTKGITLTMKLLTHESKFFKKINTLCDPNFTIVLLFTNFPLKITSFSIFQFLIPLFYKKADRVFVLLMWAKMRLSVEIYLDKFDPVSMVTP
jgi:hypothetical protein